MIKKEILQDLDGDDLTPPPYWRMTRPPPSVPPGPEAALMPNPGPGEGPAAAAAPLPAFRSCFVEVAQHSNDLLINLVSPSYSSANLGPCPAPAPTL